MHYSNHLPVLKCHILVFTILLRFFYQPVGRYERVMNSTTFITLVNNVALLLAMGVLYDAFSIRRTGLSFWAKCVAGLLIGLIGITIMSMPLSLVSGVIIDARSILLSVSGLFFGVIPSVIAAVMTICFRLFEGGQGALAGVLIIPASVMIGLLFRWRHQVSVGDDIPIKWNELYVMGVVVHSAMMLCLTALPNAAYKEVLNGIFLPVMFLFPLATVALGVLLSHQFERRKTVQALRESEHRSTLSMQKLEATFAAIPDLLFEMDINGRYYACHTASKDDLVAPEEELLGNTVFDVMPYESATKVIEALRVAQKENVSRGVQVFLPIGDRDGEFELSVSKKPAVDEQPERFIVLSRDISERKKAEQELHIAATAFDSQEGMLITDERHRILRVNNAFTRVTGYNSEEVVGQTPAVLQSGKHQEAFYLDMAKSLKDHNYWQGEIWNKRKSGELYPQYLTITAVQSEAGGITNYVGAFTDITQRKKDEADIHKLAFYDALTGLPNRRSLQERLDSALHSARITKQLGAVLFIDLDNFKNLNDTKGHDLGDQLLVEVAKRLSRCVRNADMVARLGGDEFIIILENLGVDEAALISQVKQIVTKVVSSLHGEFVLEGGVHHSSCSVGVALFNANDSTDEVMKRSDMAMYQAKESGKDTYKFFDPDAEKTLCTLTELEADLRKALPQKQLTLYFQAQYHGDTLIGAEVLLRWVHPQRGVVSPAEFIPLAESTGLIVPIGDWVLRRACQQLQLWQDDAATKHLSLAVNVSARQFCQENFVEEVQSCIDMYGVDPNLLKLELTESLVLIDIEDTIEKMQRLRDLGIRFALDDFGTGYSSLLHLKRLPLDQIKIDHSFIRDIATDPDDAEIVQTIIAMGQNLRLNVIAEGVEYAEQVDFLNQRNCDSFQGYLFGRPEPIEQFAENHFTDIFNQKSIA